MVRKVKSILADVKQADGGVTVGYIDRQKMGFMFNAYWDAPSSVPGALIGCSMEDLTVQLKEKGLTVHER